MSFKNNEAAKLPEKIAPEILESLCESISKHLVESEATTGYFIIRCKETPEALKIWLLLKRGVDARGKEISAPFFDAVATIEHAKGFLGANGIAKHTQFQFELELYE